MEIPIRKESIGNRGRGDFFSRPEMASRPQVQQQEEKMKTSSRKDDSFAMRFLKLITKYSIYITVFFLPLFFLPNVPSVLELNKQMLLVIVVGIGFLSWVGKMAWKNEIRFKKTFILVPLVTFLAIYGISSFFSIYADQSIWGYFGGENWSFVSVLFFAALFVLILNNIDSKKEALNVLLMLILSGFFVALYGVFQLWGKFVIPFEITKNNFFNSVGSVYIFGVYIGALFLLALSIFMENVSKFLKIVLIGVLVFFFFILIVINFKVLWITLMIAMALLLGFAIVKGKINDSQARVLPMIFLVLSLFMILQKRPLIKKDLPTEVSLNQKTSINIVLGSFKENALLGSGPATFVNVYQMNRPANLGNFWSVNFNSAVSYFLTLSATTGILGTLAFLFLVISGVLIVFKVFIQSISRREVNNFMEIGVGVVWLFVTAVLFLYVGNMTLLMLWWVLFGLFILFSQMESNQAKEEFITTSDTPTSSLVLSFVFVLVIIGFVSAIYLQSQKYIASAYFNKALVSDAKGENIDVISQNLQQAVAIDSSRDIYYRNMSVALFALANKRVGEKGQDLSAEDSNYVSEMIEGAINSANSAKSLSDKDAQNHIAVAQILEGMIATMDKASEQAVQSYKDASALDPNNPIYYQKIANIYIALSDLAVAKNVQQNQNSKELPEESKKNLASAQSELEKALSVKGDYADANVLLAAVFDRQGDLNRAIEKEKSNKAMYPNVPGLVFQLGLLYYRNDQLKEAQAEFEQAITMDKDYSNARYFLGLILDKNGKKQEAIEQFTKILALNPDNAEVKKIIENLKNNKEALDGVTPEKKQQQSTIDPPANKVETVNNEQQPSINPRVENQPIPKEATPVINNVEKR